MKETREMRVLFLPTNVGPVIFWRMAQFCDYMRKKGVDAAIYKYDSGGQVCGNLEADFSTKRSTQIEIVGLAKRADVCVLQYAHSPLMLALIECFQTEKQIDTTFACEIDDYIIDTPDYNPAFKQGFKPGIFNEKVIIEQMKVSRGVICSTDYLADQYKSFNDNAYTIPNAIDFTRWNRESGNKDNKRIRIGWIGGGNHEEDLRILEHVIPEITKKFGNVEFVIVHGAPEYLKKVLNNNPRCSYVKKWVNINKYPEHVAKLGFDIGLAPLTDNKFNRAKSNLRWLEYSAVKIPAVTSDIEPYKKSIKHGQTGYLCTTLNDWIDNISLLVKSKALRKEVGNNAYDEVYRNFNIEKVTDKYIKVLKELRHGQGRFKVGNTLPA